MLTINQTADQLSLCRDHVYRLIQQGSLAAYNIATGDQRPTWRIRQADIDAFLSGRRNTPEELVSIQQATQELHEALAEARIAMESK